MKLNYCCEIIPAPRQISRAVQRIIHDLPRCEKYNFGAFYYRKNDEWRRTETFLSGMNRHAGERNTLPAMNFPGIYLLSKKDQCQYVGISSNVINRIKQHFTGKKHTNASLAFLQAKHKAVKEGKASSNSSRGEVPFDDYRETIQRKMREQWSIQVLPEDNYYVLTCAEVYIAAAHHCYWNSFSTH